MTKREKAINARLVEINASIKEDPDRLLDESLRLERRKLLIELDQIQEKRKKVRIGEEVKRLNAIYKDADTNTNSYLEGIIKRAAFMRITLEDYEDDIRINGSTEFFTQSLSTPPYTRERPVIRLYNTMNKNYQSIMRQLADALPDSLRPGTEEDFDAFCRGG